MLKVKKYLTLLVSVVFILLVLPQAGISQIHELKVGVDGMY